MSWWEKEATGKPQIRRRPRTEPEVKIRRCLGKREKLLQRGGGYGGERPEQNIKVVTVIVIKC